MHIIHFNKLVLTSEVIHKYCKQMFHIIKTNIRIEVSKLKRQLFIVIGETMNNIHQQASVGVSFQVLIQKKIEVYFSFKTLQYIYNCHIDEVK